MKKIVKNINGIEIDVRSKTSLYVTIGNWTVYIDNSTNEKIISHWKKVNGSNVLKFIPSKNLKKRVV